VDNDLIQTRKGYVVPKNISLDNLKNSSSLRNDGIAPTICYIHKKSGNTIWRSSEINFKYMNTTT
jgi:hypothetical protein